MINFIKFSSNFISIFYNFINDFQSIEIFFIPLISGQKIPAWEIQAQGPSGKNLFHNQNMLILMWVRAVPLYTWYKLILILIIKIRYIKQKLQIRQLIPIKNFQSRIKKSNLLEEKISMKKYLKISKLCLMKKIMKI